MKSWKLLLSLGVLLTTDLFAYTEPPVAFRPFLGRYEVVTGNCEFKNYLRLDYTEVDERTDADAWQKPEGFEVNDGTNTFLLVEFGITGEGRASGAKFAITENELKYSFSSNLASHSFRLSRVKGYDELFDFESVSSRVARVPNCKGVLRKMNDTRVYKILRESEWSELETNREFRGSPTDLADGFIHLAKENQVEAIINRFFSDAPTIYILQYDGRAFGQDLKYESSSSGEEYPHLYHRPLTLDNLTGMRVRASESTP